MRSGRKNKWRNWAKLWCATYINVIIWTGLLLLTFLRQLAVFHLWVWQRHDNVVAALLELATDIYTPSFQNPMQKCCHLWSMRLLCYSKGEKTPKMMINHQFSALMWLWKTSCLMFFGLTLPAGFQRSAHHLRSFSLWMYQDPRFEQSHWLLLKHAYRTHGLIWKILRTHDPSSNWLILSFLQVWIINKQLITVRNCY